MLFFITMMESYKDYAQLMALRLDSTVQTSADACACICMQVSPSGQPYSIQFNSNLTM